MVVSIQYIQMELVTIIKLARWLRIKHIVYDDNYYKNIMERAIQYIKDRTECFDDYFPYNTDNCNKKHVINWFKYSQYNLM
jgi:hypothetical protein